MRGGIAGRGGGNAGGRGGGSGGGNGGGRAGGNGGGKVKGGGKNLVRNSISTGGIVGGSRFLTADRERELRENVLRRNSEALIVVEHSEDRGGRKSRKKWRVSRGRWRIIGTMEMIGLRIGGMEGERRG